LSTKLRIFPFVLLCILALACSSGEDEKFPEVTVIDPDKVDAILVNSEIVVGSNRLVFGIVAPDGRLIVDAKVHAVFYELQAGEALRRFETDAVSRVPARDAGIEEQVAHVHADGSRHIHLSINDQTGFYTAVVTFDKAGDWGVELQVDSTEPAFKGELRPRFNVLENGFTPALGAAAPRSHNLTVADVTDLALIDSSAKPSPEMHTTTIAAAIEAGKPALVLFAVPGFCTSALCGPELEIMRKLYPQYRDRAEFIHVEFYKDPGTNKVVSDAAREWNLRTEPYFFLIDKAGNIAAKFEGPTSLQELDEALKAVLR
jgi:hypothetical protein